MFQELKPSPVETAVGLLVFVATITLAAAEIKRRMSLMRKKIVSDPMEAPLLSSPLYEMPFSSDELNYFSYVAGIGEEIRAQRAASDALEAALAQKLAKAQPPATPRVDVQQSLPIEETITLPSGELKITPFSFPGPVILGPQGRGHWESHSGDAAGEDVEK